LIDISLGQQAGNGAAAVGAGARLAVGLLSPPMDGESAALMLGKGSEDGSSISVKLGLDKDFEDGFEDG
jgi:hypothetical protein